MDIDSKLKRLDRLNGLLIRSDRNSVVYSQLLDDILRLRQELNMNEQKKNEEILSPILEDELAKDQIDSKKDVFEDNLNRNEYLEDDEYIENVHNFDEMNKEMDNENYQQDFILSNLPSEYLNKVNQRLLISLCNYFTDISYIYLAELCIDTDNNEEEIYRILLE
jgi:hypothetical protein